MKRKIDWQSLRTVCRKPTSDLTPIQASNAILELGPLARSLLHPEVFARASTDPLASATVQAGWQAWHRRPRVPAGYGAAWVVFVSDAAAELPLLRNAFVLPFRWKQNEPHGSGLPAEMRPFADRVLKSIRDSLPETKRDWGLHLAGGLERMDLSDLHVKPDSGWAPLAAGLYTAAVGGEPNPAVWATGSWSFEDGLLRVDDVAIKAELAAEFGATDFFAPTGQEADFQPTAASAIRLHALRTGTLLATRSLEDLLLRLDAPPDAPTSPTDGAGIARCRDYFLRRPPRHADTNAYYQKCLLPFLIERRKKEVQQQYPECRPTHLITIVSTSPELVELTARAFEVDHCLLLHTPDERQETLAFHVKASLESTVDGRKPIAGKPVPFDSRPGEITQNIAAAVAEFVQNSERVDPRRIITDLTPGTKLMTYALSRVAPSGSWLVYLQHGWRDGRPVPDTEKLHPWEVNVKKETAVTTRSAVSYIEV